jgi:hypothetical protein
MRMRSAFSLLAAVAGAAAIAGYAVSARSADHLDGPAATGAPTKDITDVFTWMDGNNVVLAMLVYPNAPTGTKFDNHVQYVMHTASAATFGAGGTNPVDVIATFDTGTPQKIQLWVGANEYVTGDPSATTGLASADGKVKVFAGLRADPFFFNLDGLKQTAVDVEGAAASLTFNDAGCPLLDGGTAGALAGQLSHAADGGAAANNFAAFNELAIVVTVDKSLLTQNGAPLMTMWAGTYSF